MRRLFATAWTIWLIDFVTKAWALQSLSANPRPVIGTFLQFTLVHNSGAAFSFATGLTLLFSLLALAPVPAEQVPRSQSDRSNIPFTGILERSCN